MVTQLGGTEQESDNEFEFISRKTSQITKKVEELDENLRYKECLLHEQLMKSTFLVQNFSPDDIRSSTMRQSWYIAALVEKTDHDAEASEKFPILKSALRELTLSMTDIDYINTSPTSFAFIMACADQPAAMEKAMELFSRINLLACVQVQVALSDSVKGAQNLKKAYDQCSQLFEYSYLLSGRLFLTARALEKLYCDG